MSEKRAKTHYKSFVIVDIETTGFNPVKDKIIEVAFIKIVNGKEVARFESFINPENMYVSSYIQNMTGIKQKHLDTAPTFESLAKDIYDFLSDSIFVAHNVNFDYGFIKGKLDEVGLTYNSKRLCTVRLFKSFVPGLKRYGLDGLINYYGIDVKNRHRAMGDAEVLLNFWQTLHNNFGKGVINSKVKLLVHKPKIPPKILESDIDKLKNLPGVYIFYNKDNFPIYIGKSIKVKSRVLSHFSNVTSRLDQKINDEAYRVTSIDIVGEFGALVLESKLIKKLQPLYNKRLRVAKKLKAVIEQTNYTSYCKTKIVDIEKVGFENLHNIVGVFKNNIEAKNFLIQKAQRYNLCEKLLGVTKDNCFKSKVGKCTACTGSEDFIRYNIRFIQAFAGSKINKWPYKGPIIINEQNSDAVESHLVYKWCYLGKIETDIDIKSIINDDLSFNYDEYKILKKFIEDNRLGVEEVVLSD